MLKNEELMIPSCGVDLELYQTDVEMSCRLKESDKFWWHSRPLKK